MSGFTTGTNDHLIRSNLWSNQLKEVLLDELMGTRYVDMITDFPDGDTINIPSIGQAEVADYVEDQQVRYTAMDTGNFTFSIDQYKSSATYITNRMKQDSMYMDRLVASFVPKQNRAIMKAMEAVRFLALVRMVRLLRTPTRSTVLITASSLVVLAMSFRSRTSLRHSMLLRRPTCHRLISWLSLIRRSNTRLTLSRTSPTFRTTRSGKVSLRRASLAVCGSLRTFTASMCTCRRTLRRVSVRLSTPCRLRTVLPISSSRLLRRAPHCRPASSAPEGGFRSTTRIASVKSM